MNNTYASIKVDSVIWQSLESTNPITIYQHTCWFTHSVCVCMTVLCYFPAIVLYMYLHTTSSLTQLEIWSTLGAILHRSLSNIHMCRQLHLIHHCLDYLRKTTSDKVASECSVNQFWGACPMYDFFSPTRSCDQSYWDTRQLQPLTERAEGHSLLSLHWTDEILGELVRVCTKIWAI